MKKIMFVLLTALFCLGTICCQAEPATESVTESITETEKEEGTAVLRFSSFDGGGPEYRVEIEDPELVTCTWQKEYDNPDHDMMPGAGYDVICSFTGLKSGTTKMAVHVSSPLMEDFDDCYTVIVDDDLNVTLHHERGISRFEFYRNGEMFYDSYEIVTLMDGYSVSVNGEEFRSVDDEIVDALYEVVEKYDLYRWDGFNKSRSGVLDGEGFRLEISFTDGTSIQANGDNAFPEDYFSAMGEMQEILDGIRETSGTRSESRAWVVGTDIPFEDIRDFYYTYDASTGPPHYQRYRFYLEDGKKIFYHETREGGGWPQTGEDITASGNMELSDEEWSEFCACIENGTVRGREEVLDDGDAGPWMYLYWNGDLGEYQEYTFASYGQQLTFEAFCEALREKNGE